LQGSDRGELVEDLAHISGVLRLGAFQDCGEF
jgi:hypothetical protein